MKQFTDNQGRAWNVEINVDAIKRVRGTCGVDLLDASDKQKSLLTDLATDPVLLVDVIYVVCRLQADDRGVSDEDFGRAMAGDAIDRATEALLEEVVNFTPNPRDRERMRKMLGKMNVWLEKTRDFLDTKLDDPRLDRAVESQLQTFDDSFGNLPGLSESSPDR